MNPINPFLVRRSTGETLLRAADTHAASEGPARTFSHPRETRYVRAAVKSALRKGEEEEEGKKNFGRA